MVWCLFIYDTMHAFHNRSFLVHTTSTTVKKDASNFLGGYLKSTDFICGDTDVVDENKQIGVPILQLWRMEVTVMIERIRWSFLSSRCCNIVRPNNWGCLRENHLKLISSDGFKQLVQPVLNQRCYLVEEKPTKLYLKEMFFP